VPELPEVEVVRSGLQAWASEVQVAEHPIERVDVLHPRAVRRAEVDLRTHLVGARVRWVSRRGKYLWLPLVGSDSALVAHLGMSGQLLLVPVESPDERHLRIRIRFEGLTRELRFADQRTFGGLMTGALIPDGSGGHLPEQVAHIARDPLDPLLDLDATVHRIRSKDVQIKRVLLDQAVLSGIGNIYADEALWRARIHGRRPARSLPRAEVVGLIEHVRQVMRQALAQGGTSFDALYVNVNGSSGYFERSLQAYGREGEPCERCGSPIRRERFMNRSSYLCPRCQRPPRRR